MLAAIGDLRAWFQRDDAQASIYLTTDAAIENAAIVSANRWASVRDDLRRDGAPDALLAAVDELVPEAHRSGACLAAFGVLRTMVDRITVRGALCAEDLLLMIKQQESKHPTPQVQETPVPV